MVTIELDSYPEVYHLGEVYRGQVLLQVDQEQIINRLGYRLIVESRGMVGSQQHIILQKELLNRTSIPAGTNRTFPFEFVNNHYESYRGKNVSFLIRIEAFVELPPRAEVTPAKGLGKWLGGSDRTTVKQERFDDSIVLRYQSLEAKYLFPSEEYSLMVDHQSIIFIIGILIGLLIASSFLMPKSYQGYIVFFAFAFFIGGLGFYYWLGQWVKEWRLRLEKIDEKQFEIQVNNIVNWKSITSLGTWYEIEESVIDRRGTSPNTLTKTIFQSEEVIQKNIGKSVRLRQHFPTKNHPASLTMNDAKIHWLIKIKVRLFSILSFTFERSVLPNKSK